MVLGRRSAAGAEMSDTVCETWQDNEIVEFVGNKASSLGVIESHSLLLLVDSTFHARQLLCGPIVGVRKYSEVSFHEYYRCLSFRNCNIYIALGHRMVGAGLRPLPANLHSSRVGKAWLQSLVQ